MSVYFVANIRIHDKEEYHQYLISVDEVFSRYNGTYLAVDEKPLVLEGSWDYTKVVIIRFPSETDLRAWYDSDAYQAILKHRLSGAACDTLLVHGNGNTQ